MTDDEKLNGDEREEEHKANDIISTDHELPKGFNDAAGRCSTFAAMKENATAGSDIERQTEECKQQQQAGKY